MIEQLLSRLEQDSARNNPKLLSKTQLLQLVERITDLPYPSIREAFLPLLAELLELSRRPDPRKGEYDVDLPQFCRDLSQHCPLLGTLSYRVKALGGNGALTPFSCADPVFLRFPAI